MCYIIIRLQSLSLKVNRQSYLFHDMNGTQYTIVPRGQQPGLVAGERSPRGRGRRHPYPLRRQRGVDLRPRRRGAPERRRPASAPAGYSACARHAAAYRVLRT